MRRFFSILIELIFFCAWIQGQPANDDSFVSEKPISDVLYAIGVEAQVTIVPDESVSGKIAISTGEISVFKDIPNPGAAPSDVLLAKLDDFFKSKNIQLFITRENEAFFVSMVAFEYDKDSRTISIDADNVELRYIVGAIVRGMKISFVYNSISDVRVSIHEKDAAPATIFSDLETKVNMTDSTFLRFGEVLNERINGTAIAHVSFSDTSQVIDNMELREFIWRMESELSIRIISDLTVNLDKRIACRLDTSDLAKGVESVFDSNHIFVVKEGDNWLLSSMRFKDDSDPTADPQLPKLYAVDLFETGIEHIVERISHDSATMIITDPLPSKKITLSKTKCSLAEILEAIAAQTDGFKLEVLGSGYYLWDSSRSLFGLR
jgi:hypothetical protein